MMNLFLKNEVPISDNSELTLTSLNTNRKPLAFLLMMSFIESNLAFLTGSWAVTKLVSKESNANNKNFVFMVNFRLCFRGNKNMHFCYKNAFYSEFCANMMPKK